MSLKTFNELHPLVLQWGEERELFNPEHGATPLSQLRKFFEEFGELNQALNKQDREGIKDAIGDCQVCLINYAKLRDVFFREINYDPTDILIPFSDIQLEALHLETIKLIYKVKISKSIMFLEALAELNGFKPWECLNFAYNEIKDRKGKMINRTFVKDN